MSILFAHANGFVGSSYNSLFQALRPYSVDYISCFADRPLYQPQNNILPLVTQLIDQAQRLSSNEPIIGIGHSMGAVVTLMAYYRCPSLFKKIILMDPPLFVLRKGFLIALVQQLNIAGQLIPPAKKAKRRQHRFPSRAIAKQALMRKPFFQNFHPQALNDYIQHGFSPTDSGDYQLVIDKTLEYKLFCLAPSCRRWFFKPALINLMPLKIPNFFIYSAQYDLLKPNEIRYIARKLTNTHFIPIMRGHMFPLEAPQEVGHLIKQLIRS